MKIGGESGEISCPRQQPLIQCLRTAAGQEEAAGSIGATADKSLPPATQCDARRAEQYHRGRLHRSREYGLESVAPPAFHRRRELGPGTPLIRLFPGTITFFRSQLHSQTQHTLPSGARSSTVSRSKPRPVGSRRVGILRLLRARPTKPGAMHRGCILLQHRTRRSFESGVALAVSRPQLRCCYEQYSRFFELRPVLQLP